MENNFSIIISTCDKFSDLWDAHILLLNQNWADRNVETFLVTDKPTDRTFENVTVVAAGEGTEITERLRAVMPLIKTEYVLFTLDDYFLTERISTRFLSGAWPPDLPKPLPSGLQSRFHLGSMW